jgi:GTP cyclohydrolase IA
MVDALSDSLRRLQTQKIDGESKTGVIEEGILLKRSISRDGYGFRKSGMSTPLISASTPDGPRSKELVPDPNGLGWPGVFSSLTL